MTDPRELALVVPIGIDGIVGVTPDALWHKIAIAAIEARDKEAVDEIEKIAWSYQRVACPGLSDPEWDTIERLKKYIVNEFKRRNVALPSS